VSQVRFSHHKRVFEVFGVEFRMGKVWYWLCGKLLFERFLSANRCCSWYFLLAATVLNLTSIDIRDMYHRILLNTDYVSKTNNENTMLFFLLKVCSEISSSNVTLWLPPDHLLLDIAPNLGPLISRWEINQVRKLLIQKCQDFRGSKAFVQQFFEFVKVPTRYEWSNIRGTVQ
jgi:hypothetical protein